MGLLFHVFLEFCRQIAVSGVIDIETAFKKDYNGHSIDS